MCGLNAALWTFVRSVVLLGQALGAKMDDKINLAQKLATFSEYWSPRTVAQLNNYDVMVV